MKDHLNQPRRSSWRRLITFVLLLVLASFLIWEESRSPDKVVVSKGGPLLEFSISDSHYVDQNLARQFTRNDPEIAEILERGDFGFLYAFPLSESESRLWRDRGCQANSCAQATYYDYIAGGTFEIVVSMESGRTIDSWQTNLARPGASANLLPRAIGIASRNEEVRSFLGDIRQADAMMAPMSTWLTDSSCMANWCIDLTFASPDESGRIYHVVVDLELDRVARTFFTRGRPDRVHQEEDQEVPDFEDGCEQKYGWEICWEMTAHDGLNFIDASFQDRSIFTSAKIGQVEVYYPSWPGGYRDEIGFGASVRPYYGTQVDDLGNGIEVSQLFTEFLSWPNCVCCYRYEQIMRFYDDGSYEADFISHGPGCDDLSSYRPFWRINLADEEIDPGKILFMNQGKWESAEIEIQLPLFSDSNHSGEILQLVNEEVDYVWSAARTDPLEDDEGWLFLLNHRDSEGDGPLATGPADSFWPPGQWLGGEDLSAENLVLWYVPILKTKHGEPWWCMPDPEPDYSPCNAVLRAQAIPAEVLLSPTPHSTELSEPPPTETQESTLTPIPIPPETPTRRPIAGQEPENIILNSGCGSCHKIGSLGESGKVGPDLSNIGIDAASRVPGQSAADYIRESMLNPSAFIASECPNGPCLENVMPSDYRTRLTDIQIQTLVDFLLIQQRENPNQEEIGSSDERPVEEELSEKPTAVKTRASQTNTRLIKTTVTIGSILVVLFLSFVIVLLLILLKVSRRKPPPRP